jgi:hypothetical protein
MAGEYFLQQPLGKIACPVIKYINYLLLYDLFFCFLSMWCILSINLRSPLAVSLFAGNSFEVQLFAQLLAEPFRICTKTQTVYLDMQQ